jgi:hypothetical protein
LALQEKPRSTGVCVCLAVDDSLNIPYHDDREHWDEWVTKVTKALDPLTLEFAHAHDEFSGQHVYGIVRWLQIDWTNISC